MASQGGKAAHESGNAHQFMSKRTAERLCLWQQPRGKNRGQRTKQEPPAWWFP
ncbi:hypothetical protein ACFFLM_15525 [Deinococcus oregonensis]|uniref:Uncharacterized protein n=1 Tax=Deinococcus oregonensis TaxID=1805970 RepID=A0ABV6B0V5_9DEIO